MLGGSPLPPSFSTKANYMGSLHRQTDKVSYANEKYGIRKPNINTDGKSTQSERSHNSKTR